jgi:DNA-directed RNA polymerase subunit RPC12/RpoP
MPNVIVGEYPGTRRAACMTCGSERIMACPINADATAIECLACGSIRFVPARIIPATRQDVAALQIEEGT